MSGISQLLDKPKGALCEARPDKMASVMEAFNASTTHYPGTVRATIATGDLGILSRALEHVNFLSVFFTLFAIAVAYDQST